MTKKMFFLMIGVITLTFLFSGITVTPMFAQEQQKEEDIEDFSLEDLLNVEITTAGKKAEKVSEIPASIVIITRKDIEEYGYANLVEVLESIPGLYLIDDLGYAGGFGVRGFWTYDAKNIIVLVNDFKMFEGQASRYELNNLQLPVEAIDRIEVIRGPMSVMYGSGAFFGVINIKTNVVSDNEDASLLALTLGNEDTYRAAARFAGKAEDFSYILNAGLFGTGGPDEHLSSMASNPATYAGQPDTTAGRLEDSAKYFSLSGTYKNFYGSIVYNSRGTEEYFFLPSASDGYEVIYDYVNVGFGYKKEVSEKVTLDFKFDYGKNFVDRRADYFAPNYRGTEYIAAAFFEMELTSVFAFTEKLNLVLGVNHNVITDADTRLNHYLFGLLQWGGHLEDGSNISTSAIFAQGDYQLTDKLKIVAGLRLERQGKYELYYNLGPQTDLPEPLILTGEYDKDDVEFIPRFAAIYSINDNHYLKFMYGKAINRPSFYNTSQQVWSGYDNLDSEEITTFELNYLGNFSDKANVSLSLFYNILDKLMVRTHFFDSQGEYHSFFGNGGKLITKGAELSLLFRPSQKFKLQLSGTFQDTSDERDGYGSIDVGYSPKFLGYVQAVYHIGKDASLAITGNYVDKMETLWDGVPDPALGGGRIAQTVDGYFNLGANLRINNLFGKGFYINIRGSNLLNKLILYPQYTNNSSWADKGSLGPRLLIYGTIGLKF